MKAKLKLAKQPSLSTSFSKLSETPTAPIKNSENNQQSVLEIKNKFPNRLLYNFRRSLPTGLSVETFRWTGGFYFLILGMSLLILPPGSYSVWFGQPWLAGVFFTIAGFALLWVGVLSLPRRFVVIFSGLIALPLFYMAFSYWQQNSMASAVLVGLVTLGFLYANSVPKIKTISRSNTDLLGLIFGAAQAAQGVDFLTRPSAAVIIPAQLGISNILGGIIFVVAGGGVVITQLLPVLPQWLKWATHLLSGLTVLGLWVSLSAFLAAEYWVLGVAVVLRGSSTLILPWWTQRIQYFDNLSFRPRVALALITAAVAPLLLALPLVLNSVDESPATLLGLRQTTFGITTFLAIIAGVGGWWLAGRLTIPVTKVMQGVNQIAEGRRNINLLQTGTTEIMNLSRAVEKMARNLDARMMERETMVAQLQAQNRHLQELQETREDYLRALSHDLRNPLTGVIGFGQQLARKLSQQNLEKEANNAQTIVRLGKHLNTMIEELVMSLKLEAGLLEIHLEKTHLPTLASEVAKVLNQAEQNSRISLQVPLDVPLVLGDTNSLERIFTNLLSNALKYSPPDSPIELKFSLTETELQVAIKDNGQGISQEEQANLFTRYYRTNRAKASQSGLGLGLYVTRTLVEAHKGRIWVESTLGAGSTFYFTLPLQNSSVVNAPNENRTN